MTYLLPEETRDRLLGIADGIERYGPDADLGISNDETASYLRQLAERSVEGEECDTCDDTGIYEEGSEWAPCSECERGREFTASWQEEILNVGAEALENPGAVIVRLTTEAPEAVSRVYNADDYETTTDLRRVAMRRCTQLFNSDHGGWNYYVVIRYATGQIVAWTGMHSILTERKVIR